MAGFEVKYAGFKNFKIPRGNYQTDGSEIYYCLYCLPLNFLPRTRSKNYIELFSTFLDESR